tara:strand:- start:49 stop:222 length:174 start_codon:yes stop_codon:yes gene_type:complete
MNKPIKNKIIKNATWPECLEVLSFKMAKSKAGEVVQPFTLKELETMKAALNFWLYGV